MDQEKYLILMDIKNQVNKLLLELAKKLLTFNM